MDSDANLRESLEKMEMVDISDSDSDSSIVKVPESREKMRLISISGLNSDGYLELDFVVDFGETGKAGNCDSDENQVCIRLLLDRFIMSFLTLYLL